MLDHEDVGRGVPVLLIHGHPFDRRMWAPQVRDLSDVHRVIAPDLPGYGRSPPSADKITMRELAEAVLALLDELEVDPGVVVGLSMGGLVAMELALRYPERFHGAVFAATTAAPVTPEEAATRRAVADDVVGNGMLAHALDMAGKLFGPGARSDPDLVEKVFGMMIHTSPEGAAAALRGRAERPDYSRLLRELRVPSLVVSGEQDHWAPEPVVEQLVGALPEPRVLRLPGVGHLPNLEAPDEFNAALRSFAAAVAPRRWAV
jgi:3-oxoadipate enol-lactonase